MPISRLPGVVETQWDLQDAGLTGERCLHFHHLRAGLPAPVLPLSRVPAGPMVGHVGNGNFHCILVFHPEDTDTQAPRVFLGKSLCCCGTGGLSLGRGCDSVAPGTLGSFPSVQKAPMSVRVSVTAGTVAKPET